MRRDPSLLTGLLALGLGLAAAAVAVPVERPDAMPPSVPLGRTLVRGNSRTRSNVILRELAPMTNIDIRLVHANCRHLEALGWFSRVEAYASAPAPSGARDLVYAVEEQPTARLDGGIGASSIGEAVGFLSLSQTDFDLFAFPFFSGGGQRAEALFEYGYRRETFDVSWTEPWFLDRPIALSLDASRTLRWSDPYTTIRTGGSADLSYRLARADSRLPGAVGVRYTLERVDMTDIDDGRWYYDRARTLPAGDYFREEKFRYGGAYDSVIGLFWRDDTRDRLLATTRGHRATLSADFAEGALGDNAFYRLGADAESWFPLPWLRHVLSVRGRLATVDAFGGGLPVYERLYLGGPRSLRGFKYREVGPKLYSADDHAALGGRSLALVSAEYTVPVWGILRLATFCDAGSVGADAFDPDLARLGASAGVGLRIDWKYCPIRIDFAVPVTRQPETRRQLLSFMIGFD